MKGQWSKLFVVAIGFLLLAGACVPAATPLPTPTPVPPTPTPDPAAPVKAWVDAMNSGDVDAMLALFADDLKFSVFEYNATDKDQLRGIFDWLAGLETKYQITECQTKEDRVVCTMPVSDACIAGYDPVAGLMSNMTFVSQQDGKISQVSGYPDGFGDYYAKWISPAMSWMRANRAEELAKAESTSDGREAGAINAKLCREYGESLKATPTAAGATKPAGKQVLLVVGLEQSDDMELMLTQEVAVVVSMLEKAGYKVVVASASGKPITGGATTLTPDLKLADVQVDDYVGFMFPCLAVDMELPLPPEAVRIAKEAVTQGKPVAAQNGGVVTLATAGVLNGKQFALLEDPGAYVPGGIYKGTGVVQDGNIITSGTCPYMARETGRTDGTPELTKKLIDLLAEAAGDPLSLAKAYQDALNKRDPDAFLALFADGGFTYTDDTTTYRNKDELRLAIEAVIAHGNTLEFDSCETKGSELHCVTLNRNDYCIRAVLGLDVARTETIFTAKDGKIGSVKIALLPEDQAAMGQAYPKFEAWLRTNRPDEWEKLGSPGAYDLKGRALGELSRSMCKAYLEATKK